MMPMCGKTYETLRMRGLSADQAKIEIAKTLGRDPSPKDQAYAVCFDDSRTVWEVCCWSSKARVWLRPDGGAPQFSPSSWVKCSGDFSGTKNAQLLNVLLRAHGPG